MIRVLVVDDHEPCRRKACLDLAAGNLIEILATAASSDQAYSLACKLLPDVVLLDLHLPGLLSTDVLLKKLLSLRNLHVVIFADRMNASQVQDYFDAGASAYVLKDDRSELLRMSVLMVYRGSKKVLSAALPANLLKLSPADRQLLSQTVRAGGMAGAARQIGLSRSELRNALEAIARILEIDSVEKLCRWAKNHWF
jgi:DNA-binding NarL/FixJ family response regulator